MVNLVRRRSDLTILPPSGLKLALDGNARPAPPRAPVPEARPGGAGRVPGRPGQPPPSASARKQRRSDIAPSWWTARAQEAEVRPGFTKAEILKPRQDDPRAPGGVFERLGGLLSEMLE